MSNPNVVVVLFQVSERLTLAEAEAEVEQRLDRDFKLGQNDSMDIVRGTTDPVDTFAVVPSAQLLDDAL